MSYRANGTRATGHRANGNRADVVAPNLTESKNYSFARKANFNLLIL